jgi:hypothetical protein
MLHWIRPESVAFAGAVDNVAIPGGQKLLETPQRASHARMLAHAATRRRAAVASAQNDCRVDAVYWKTSAPQALVKARALREAGLCTLP